MLVDHRAAASRAATRNRALGQLSKMLTRLRPDRERLEGVRTRLYSTEPTWMETRTVVIVRLRNAIAWVNSKKAMHLGALYNSQKERARDVLAAQPPSARTKN